MRNKYGIGFFTAAIVLLLVLTCAYQFSYYKAKERAALEAEAKEKTESIATEGEASKEDGFYLMEVNGYLVVYLGDRKTPYEYTDIPYDELPALVREEVRNGKYIKNAEELYSFLENYSS